MVPKSVDKLPPAKIYLPEADIAVKYELPTVAIVAQVFPKFFDILTSEVVWDTVVIICPVDDIALNIVKGVAAPVSTVV